MASLYAELEGELEEIEVKESFSVDEEEAVGLFLLPEHGRTLLGRWAEEKARAMELQFRWLQRLDYKPDDRRHGWSESDWLQAAKEKLRHESP